MIFLVLDFVYSAMLYYTMRTVYQHFKMSCSSGKALEKFGTSDGVTFPYY